MIVKQEIMTRLHCFFLLLSLRFGSHVKCQDGFFYHQTTKIVSEHYRILYDTSNKNCKDSKNLFKKFGASTKIGCYFYLEMTMKSILIIIIIITQMKGTP